MQNCGKIFPLTHHQLVFQVFHQRSSVNCKCRQASINFNGHTCGDMIWFAVAAVLAPISALGMAQEGLFIKPKPKVSCPAAVTRTCHRCSNNPTEGFDCETPMRCVNCALRQYKVKSAKYQPMLKSCYSVDEIEAGCNMTKVSSIHFRFYRHCLRTFLQQQNPY